jgi:16S rRNA (guanine966-N2)-methyltransferase
MASRRELPRAGKNTRPTTGRVREALFSSLGAFVEGADVLDLFAGTGAYGFEAWSRGAARVAWVERDKAAAKAIGKAAEAFGAAAGGTRAVAADVFAFLAAKCPAPYDLVLADPPYEEARAGGWLPRLGKLLRENGWLKPGGVFVYETAGKVFPPAPEGYETLRARRYGRTTLLIFRLPAESAAPPAPDPPPPAP